MAEVSFGETEGRQWHVVTPGEGLLVGEVLAHQGYHPAAIAGTQCDPGIELVVAVLNKMVIEVVVANA